jgi:hypothetical protein
MTKWADYGVSAVRFNNTHTHIDRLRLYPVNGDSLGVAQENTRAEIVAAIKKGTTFVTIYMNSEGTWNKGQSIYIVNINGTKYLKTVDNGKTVDNVDALPEF